MSNGICSQRPACVSVCRVCILRVSLCGWVSVYACISYLIYFCLSLVGLVDLAVHRNPIWDPLSEE